MPLWWLKLYKIRATSSIGGGITSFQRRFGSFVVLTVVMRHARNTGRVLGGGAKNLYTCLE